MKERDEKDMLEVLNETKLEVETVSAYLINSPECYFSNTFDGNMKLQKLLTFANLIHYAQNDDFLFKNDMYAFRNGIVIEDVRVPFYENYHDYIDSLKKHSVSTFTESQLTSIKMSISLFNKLSAKELSDLHHQLLTWKIRYENSRIRNEHVKELGIIKREDIISSDIDKIKKVISSYNDSNESNDSHETVNGITFYYDLSEIPLSKERILDYLDSVSRSVVNGEDDTFFLAFDEEQGFYYY